MDLGSLFLILALLVLVGLFVSRPFLERRPPPAGALSDPQEHEHSALLAERDRLLTALQELDFDQALGKIPEEDYPAQRAALLQRGADVLRQLDRFAERAAPSAAVSPAGGDAEARLEAAVAARRADAAGNGRAHPGAASGAPAADDELEVLLAHRRRARGEKSVGFCPQCGGPLQKSDRFCPKCGSALEKGIGEERG